MFVRNLDESILQRFKAAVALDGLTVREVVQDLIEKYAEDRLGRIEKRGDKKK